MKTLLICLILSLSLYAHQSSLSQLELDLRGETLSGYWNISVKDLELLVGLDQNFDRAITWIEILNAKEMILSQAKVHFKIYADEKQCKLNFNELLIDRLNTNTYIHLPFHSSCKSKAENLKFSYTFLFDKDADHKGYMSIKTSKDIQTRLFSIDNQTIRMKSQDKFETFSRFIQEGVYHIWIGYDHILFLLALLLPAAFIVKNNKYVKSNSFKDNLLNILKIITAFTVAHSITLSLSVMGLINMQSWLIESIIALSVILAALNNIRPFVKNHLWILVFVFGLIHGLGFASVLKELNLDSYTLLWSLLGFNIGVEFGQIGIIILILPVIEILSRKKLYSMIVLKGGSMGIGLMGAVWLFERLAGSNLL